MFGLRLSSASKTACAIVASLMLLAPPAYAQSANQSSKCVNGYRWIVRDVNPNDSPGQNSIPVRCR